MTEHLVIPPSRVWDKIEKILDEQDIRRQFANQVIAESFAGDKKENKVKNYYLAAAGLSVLAGVYWVTKVKLGI